MSDRKEWEPVQPPFVQTERPIGEPVYYFVENLTFAQKRIARDHGIETGFVGRGGKSKARRALARILKIEK